MATPRKKPDYNTKIIMDDFLKDIVEYYEESPEVSLRDVAAEFDITLLKARKLLITAGVYSTDASVQIQELKEQGKTITEIMDKMGLSRASVHSYLPYKKGIYNARELSLDAERSRRYRQRKLAVIRLREAPSNLELLWDAIEAFTDYPFRTEHKGLKFKYQVKGNEIFIDRKKKSVTRSTVVLAYQKMREAEEIRKAKDLGTFGASYLYPIFIRLGVLGE